MGVRALWCLPWPPPGMCRRLKAAYCWWGFPGLLRANLMRSAIQAGLHHPSAHLAEHPHPCSPASACPPLSNARHGVDVRRGGAGRGGIRFAGVPEAGGRHQVRAPACGLRSQPCSSPALLGLLPAGAAPGSHLRAAEMPGAACDPCPPTRRRSTRRLLKPAAAASRCVGAGWRHGPLRTRGCGPSLSRGSPLASLWRRQGSASSESSKRRAWGEWLLAAGCWIGAAASMQRMA